MSNQYGKMCYKFSDSQERISSNLREIQPHLRAKFSSLETPGLNTKTRLSSPLLCGLTTKWKASILPPHRAWFSFVLRPLYTTVSAERGLKVPVNYSSFTLAEWYKGALPSIFKGIAFSSGAGCFLLAIKAYCRTRGLREQGKKGGWPSGAKWSRIVLIL